MKKTYFTPITKPVSIPAEELMIPSLIGPSGQEATPLNPSRVGGRKLGTLYV